jgi:hypothetical protein
VLWPQPEQPHEPRTERTGSVNRSDVRDDARLEVARLQGELAEVRARLADAQADRDRWHASATAAFERYNHDMQEMRGLLGREQVIALRASTTAVVEDAPATHESGPHSAAVVAEASESAQPAWWRWWRRMTGGAVDLF